jgi:hypothetical protein
MSNENLKYWINKWKNEEGDKEERRGTIELLKGIEKRRKDTAILLDGSRFTWDRLIDYVTNHLGKIPRLYQMFPMLDKSKRVLPKVTVVTDNLSDFIREYKNYERKTGKTEMLSFHCRNIPIRTNSTVLFLNGAPAWSFDRGADG